MMDFYVLDGDHNVVPCESVAEWSEFFRSSNRIVAKTEIGGALVSTVFLGLETYGGMFETMIFDAPKYEEYQTRCRTWEGAVRMHAAACAIVQGDM